MKQVIDIYEQLICPNSILLESLKHDTKSYIALNPRIIFKSKGNKITINNETIEGNPWKELDKLVKKYGKCFGYLGYELVHFIEKLPRNAKDDLQLPDSYLIFPRSIIEFDNNDITIIGENKEEIQNSIKKLRKKAQTKQQKINSKVDYALKTKSSYSYPQYEQAVHKAKEHVLAGDSFQVKISQRLEFDVKNPFEVYKKLRLINPSPYMAYLNFLDLQLVSCSPELLLQINNKQATTKPIGGTYPRGQNEVEDNELRKRFTKDTKELAEHTMLIDLERNDLGKVCKFGTVRVDKLMEVQNYSHLMHIVTTIKGELHNKFSTIDTIKAMFPGGTITGCPKVRTMEIINSLEPVTRGPYTGCIGMIDKNATTLSIAIRTLVCKQDKGYLHVGGGIVADSNAKREYEETLEKGMALIEAIK